MVSICVGTKESGCFNKSFFIFAQCSFILCSTRCAVFHFQPGSHLSRRLKFDGFNYCEDGLLLILSILSKRQERVKVENEVEIFFKKLYIYIYRNTHSLKHLKTE